MRKTTNKLRKTDKNEILSSNALFIAIETNKIKNYIIILIQLTGDNK